VKDLLLKRHRSSFAGIAWSAACILALLVPAAPAAATDPPPTPLVEQRPAPVTVQTLRPGTAAGLLFLTPQSLQRKYLHGPQILDNQGRLIWWRHVEDGMYATNFQVQTYRGQEVLTWWEGGANSSGQGAGIGYIADRNYQIIATVRGRQELDFHEFRLTPQGTALVMLQRQVPYDLTPIGGPADGLVMENGFQEIDVATGDVVHEWWSLDHVPITDTYITDGRPFGYFHMNSVALDTDGHYLVSGRGTHAVYKVHRRTGEILWRLGGKSSDFEMADGADFARQHDAVGEGRGIYRIFDNGVTLPEPDRASRVLWVKLDPVRRVATVHRELTHPEPMFVGVEGGSDRLPNGNTIVSWGNAARVSEFTAGGSLVFDAALPPGHSTYRAFRSPWNGRPLTDPTATMDGESTLHAVWNGATGVARWRVLGGQSEGKLRRVAEAAWNGLDTSIELPASAGTGLRYVKVQALDICGRVIGASPVTAIGL
jgi:hypothetical protein